MFDIGFWELATLAVIGLIVLGPERLPVVARTLGRWVGRARYYVNQLTTELENEIGAEDIRDDVRRAREQIESETREFRSDAEHAMKPLNEPIEGSEGGEPSESVYSDSGDPESSYSESKANVARVEPEAEVVDHADTEQPREAAVHADEEQRP